MIHKLLLSLLTLIANFQLFGQSNMIKNANYNTIYTVLKNETLVFEYGLEENGFQFTFLGHSDKRPYYENDKVPTIINVKYKFNGKIEEKSYSRHDAMPFVWRWKNFLFVITQSKFNEMIKVKVCEDSDE